MEKEVNYKELRKAVDATNEVFGKFCSLIITLSAGSVMLSVTMVDKVGFQNHKWLLITSWVCFMVAIICSLLIKLAQINAATALVNKLANKQVQGYEFGNMGRLYEIKNYGMFWGFMLGILFLTVFGIANIT